MAVYYKFKSAKDYDSIALDGPFISVANLKERIFESKHLGRGTDFDLVVTNAQTNEEYLDEEKLIPKNTSVLIRRVPRRLGMPIVAQPDEPKVENKLQDDQLANSNFTAADSSVVKDLDAFEWEDEFGHDLYATIPEVMPSQSSNPIQDAPPPSKADEDSKIKAFVESSALDWQRQSSDGFGPGRGFMRGGRMMGGRSFGRGFERKTPPPGYVCHRCKVPGHFIQHCPTNGDPNYDVKKVKPPTGIPKSMLVATPDGSYALPSGAVAVMRPNEAAFEKEIEGLPSTRSVGDLPPEFRCPLCKEVMKDAVLTSKCCFKSFCDKCVRDYIISNSVCVCGAGDILADDLLPNKTLRDTISRILESTTSSAENASSAVQVQDMESARIVQPKIPSPCQSAASKGEQIPPPPIEQAPKPGEIVNEVRPVSPQQSQQQASEKMVVTKVPDVSEATRESASVKEAASQGSAPPVEEEVQQKVAAGEAGDADLGKKKKKKKKAVMPPNAAEMQWRGPQDFAAENYMMPMGPSGYDPYWNGMQQPAMDAFMGPFPGAMPYNMGYGLGPMDMPFGGVIPQDPFAPQGFMFPPMVPPPQRDLALEFGMGMNVRPPLMTRDQFESRKADLRKKREMERRAESMELSKDREYKREASKGADLPPMKPKPKPAPQRPPSEDRYDHDRERDRDLDHHRDDRRYQCRSSSHSHRSDRLSPDRYSRDLELPRPSLKRKSSERRHHEDDDYDYDYDRHRDRDRDRDLDRRHRHHHHRRSSDPPGKSDSVSEPQPSKPMSSADLAAAESKKKASVFSRISFPEKDHSKKRKVSSSEAKPRDHDGAGGSGSSLSHRAVNGHHDSAALAAAATVRKSAAAAAAAAAAASVDYESSDDDRHFKRKPSRYQPSAADEEEGRHSKRDRGGHKHR